MILKTEAEKVLARLETEELDRWEGEIISVPDEEAMIAAEGTFGPINERLKAQGREPLTIIIAE